MIKRTDKSANGTSFHHVTFYTTPQKLIDHLGEPDYFWNDGTDKVNLEYTFELADGRVFTLYDWKEYRPLRMDTYYEFHIGANDFITSAEGKEALETIINTQLKLDL